MGRVEDYWNNLRLLRGEQYVTSGVPQFTEKDIELARTFGIDLNTEAPSTRTRQCEHPASH